MASDIARAFQTEVRDIIRKKDGEKRQPWPACLGKIFNVVKHCAIQSIAYSKKYPLSLAQATKITCLET